MMPPVARKALLLVILACLLVIAAAAWHSVDEIHYLKTFYPDRFTVQEAFFAAGVELIKVLLIGLPLFLSIGIGLHLVRTFRKDG